MRRTLLLLWFATPALARTDEGTVTAIDGKGGFQISTRNNGVIHMQASPEIMGDKPETPLPSWPNVYKQLQKGDYIELCWGKNEKTGKTIAIKLRIIRRGG